MADRVVKTVEIRESGAQRVYDRTTSLIGAFDRLAVSESNVGKATETSARKADSATRSYERLEKSYTGNVRATNELERNLKTLNNARLQGLIGDAEHLQKVLRELSRTQDLGIPRGASSGLGLMIDQVHGIDRELRSAQDSAHAFVQAFRELDTGTTPFQNTINSIHGIGQGVLDAKSSMEAFGPIFAREAQDAARAAMEAEAATKQLAIEIDGLRIAYDPAYASAQRMSQEVENLARLEREGITILGGYDAALGKIALKYDAAAQAAQKLNDAQRAGFRSQDLLTSNTGGDINSRLGVTGGYKSAQDSADAFAPMFRKADEEAASFQRRLASIKAEIDPITAAQDRYNAEVAEYINLNKQRLLSDDELAKGLNTAQTRFHLAQRSMNAFNDNTKLGANELQNLQYQLNDIGVSLASGQSPFTVLLQQGAQIGQLFGPGATVQQALKSVGAGVMSFVTNPINLAVVALAAAAGGVFAFYKAFKSDAKTVEQVLTGQADALKAIADRYGEASQAAKNYSEAANKPTSIIAGLSLQDLQKQQKAQEEALNRSLTGMGSRANYAGSGSAAANAGSLEGGILPLNERDIPSLPKFAPIQAAVEKLRTSLLDGKSGIVEFTAAMNEAYRTAGDDKDMRKAIEEAVKFGDALFKTTTAQNELKRAVLEASPAYQEAARGLKQYNEGLATLEKMQPQLVSAAQAQKNAFMAAISNARTQAEETRAVDLYKNAIVELGRAAKESAAAVNDSLNNLNLSPAQRQIAEINQDYDRRIKEQTRTNGDPAALADLQKEKLDALSAANIELKRAEDGRLAGIKSAIQFAGELTQAQAAQKAGLDAYNGALAEGFTATDAARRANEAYTVSIVQSSAALADAANARDRGYTTQVDQARLQLQLIGSTAGATAELTAKAQMLAAAKEANRSAGGIISPEELDAINQTAKALGTIAEATATRNLFRGQEDKLRGLKVEAAGLGQSDDARRKLNAALTAENELRQANLPLTGKMADEYGKGALALSDYEDRVRKVGDAWSDVQKVGEDAIDGFTNALTDGNFSDALKSFADDFTKTALKLAVANPLKNALLGTNLATFSDLKNGAGAAPSISVPAMPNVATMTVTAATVNVGGTGASAFAQPGAANDNASNRVASAFDVTSKPGDNASTADLAAYINKAAIARGIDPAIALKVARSEGLGGSWQAGYVKNGYREPSYGPFQLLKGGKGTGFPTGMGNGFMAQTGLDPSDKRNVYSGIDYALNGAAQNGWGAWYGAAKVGVGKRDGLSGAHTVAIGKSSEALTASADKLASSASSFTTDFGQITGTVNAGIGQIADQFVPGFGGVLTKLLDGMSQQSGGGGGGIGGFLGNLFGGGSISAGAKTASLANVGGGLGFFANGTDSAPGGWSMVGEQGPELRYLNRGDKIIPNSMIPSVMQRRLQMPEVKYQQPSSAPAPTIYQNFVNAPPVKSQTDESDGRGGRRQTIVFDEAVAGTVGRPGSKSARSVGSEFGLKKRIVR